jgi:hypothetical protein
MEARYVDACREVPALRRVWMLLERVQEDAPLRDRTIETLLSRIGDVRSAAVEGKLIPQASIGRIEHLLAAVPAFPASDRETEDLIRRNALAEAREVIRRLKRVARRSESH